MPVPNVNTGFKDSNGTDLGTKIVSKDYLLSVYPSIANQLTSPELWVWGRNSYGQLGVGGSLFRNTPVTTLIGGSVWKQVSGGYYVTAGIKTDGSLWVWGRNSYGQLGDNTIVTKYTPVTTFIGGNDWKQVSTGYYTTIALKIDGSLWTWGRNIGGQCGVNDLINRSTPVTTFIGGNDWKQVSNANSHNAAVKIDGSLWTWGQNVFGVLGTNDGNNRSIPTTTFAGGNDWKQVSAGGNATGAVKINGSLWTWGWNYYGQLGVNSTIPPNRSTPATTFAGGNNWKQVSMNSTCRGIKTDGSLWGWGRNAASQLGNRSTLNSRTPVTTFAGGNNWKQIGGGYTFTIAIKTDGSLWTWGSNSYGQLGTGDTAPTSKQTPVTTLIGGNNWKQASAMGTHSVAIRSTDIL